MLAIYHFLISLILGIIAFWIDRVSLINVLFFVFGATTPDIDHLFSYWYYQKEITFSYKKIKKWCFEVGYRMEHFFIFHTFWVLLVLWVLHYTYQLSSVIFYGVLLHYLLDIFYDMWHFFFKKNYRPYRRWILPFSWLKRLGLEKYL